jgi:hypothetical protein
MKIVTENKFRNGLIIFLFLISIEALMTIIWLLSIPADPKNAFIGGYSLQRISLISVFVALFIIAIILVLAVLKGNFYQRLSLIIEHNPNFTSATILGLFFISLICIYTLADPLDFFSQFKAIFTRLFPILVFISLVGIQAIIVFAIILPRYFYGFLINWINLMRKWTRNPISGYSLLIISIVLSSLSLFFTYYNYADEGDTITVGWLLSEGWVIYADLFSHHFPFPYMWVSFIVKIFGPHLLALRLSLIVLRGAVFLLAMRTSRYYFPLGLTSLIWSLWGIFYLSNMLVYDSFGGIFIISVLAISIAILNREYRRSKLDLFVIGILIGFAALTDPLMIYPGLISMAYVFLSGVLNNQVQSNYRNGLIKTVIIFSGLIITIFAFYMIFGHLMSVPGFYLNAVRFNTEIYSKYSPQATISNFIRPLISMLGITTPTWRTLLTPTFPLHDYLVLDQSIFTGFFYRAAILIACLLFFLSKRILSGLYLYLFAASLLVRGESYFHISPFVLLSLFISSLLVYMILNWENYFLIHIPRRIPIFRPNIMRVISNIIMVILLVVLALYIIRGGWYLIEHRSSLSYEANFGSLVKRAKKMERLTCNHESARLLDYPLNLYSNFLSQIPPGSKYIFMTPWVAEISQDELLRDLKEKPLLLYYPEHFYVWGYLLDDYIDDALNFINENYVQIENHYYASPQLIDLCSGTENHSDFNIVE